MTALAAAQGGVVTRAQLLAAGVTPSAVDHRLRSGLLRAKHHGVYLFGPAEGEWATEWAACLACGSSAVLSHRSAAALWELSPRPTDTVEVVVRNGCCKRPGILARRLRTVTDDEVTHRHGLPVTTPARTLLDLGGRVRPRTLARAVERAIGKRLTTTREIRELVARHPHSRGIRHLRRVLDDDRVAPTRSDAEDRFLELVDSAKLPRPTVSVVLLGHEVDFLWKDARLVAEVDGFAYHSSRAAFEMDRRRDADLTAAGYRVVRVTWRQLQREPAAVVARLAQALVRRP